MKIFLSVFLGIALGSTAHADQAGNCTYAAHLATTAMHMVKIEGQTISEPSDGVSVVPSKRYTVKLLKTQKIKNGVREIYKGEVENTGMDPVGTFTYEFSDGICEIRKVEMVK